MTCPLPGLPEDGPGLLCSVVVPVYNGAAHVERCLDALACQSVPPHCYEIVVVDDGSADGTPDQVEAWRARHPEIVLHLACQDHLGPAAARNRGAHIAAAGLLLFTEADCAPLPHWIQALTAPFADPDVAGAKGTCLTRQPGLIPRFVQAEYADRYRRMAHEERIDFVDTYSAAYRSSLFCANGGFDTTFTVPSMEDQEFSFRLARKGYRLVFLPDAQVYHDHDTGVWQYARRKYLTGFWKAHLMRWHPERMVQDSHTPQVLKLQLVLWMLAVLLLPLAVAGWAWPPLAWAWGGVALALLLFLLTAAPLVAGLARTSTPLALCGLGLLSVRALALGAGYLVGTVYFAGMAAGTRRPVIPGWKRLLKRLMDIAGALAGLLLSAPFILLAAGAIKLDSPGPVFYRQIRIGENGRSFRIYKLRSMQADAEERLPELVDLHALPEPVYKLAGDPRVTRVGRILRRTSLDEAPQFYNVLRGDMSLVGPRPEEARIVALYNDYQRQRLAVKPGLTGPMQVNGRGDLSLSQRLQLELDYIEHYSLLRDVEILWRTLPAVWQGKGAH